MWKIDRILSVTTIPVDLPLLLKLTVLISFSFIIVKMANTYIQVLRTNKS